MIDALAAVISYLRTDADLALLIEDRIGSRHRYGLTQSGIDVWPNGSQALVLHPTGGEQPDDQAGQIRMRVQALGYGDDQTLASQVLDRVRAISQAFIRTTTLCPDGQTALIYWIATNDSVEFDKDLDLQNSDGGRLDVARTVLRIAVADQAV